MPKEQQRRKSRKPRERGERRVCVHGEEALARAVLEAGTSYATGFPGSPGPGVLEHLARLSWASDVELHWAGSPRAAVEWAHGASLAGRRTVACLSGQAFAEAFPAVVAAARIGSGAGLLFIVGDDCGAWDAYAELDSRVLAAAAEVPAYEPSTIAEALYAVGEAYRVSRSYDLPVVLRITIGFTEEESSLRQGGSVPAPSDSSSWHSAKYGRLALPITATQRHERLHAGLDHLRHTSRFGRFVEAQGQGKKGVIAVGHVHTKLMQVLGEAVPEGLRVLRLGQVFPPPDYQLLEFALALEEVLVLEEGEPFVEGTLRSLISEHIQKPRIRGKIDGTVSRVGELQRWHIEEVLGGIHPSLPLERTFFPLEEKRDRPSLSSVCLDCTLEQVFNAVVETLAGYEEPNRPLIVGDHGCVARLTHKPWQTLDVLPAPGGALGVAMGMISAPAERRVLALVGDYAFADQAFANMAEAAARNLPLTLLVLDNRVGGYTGGQPRPGREHVALEDLIGATQPAVLRVIEEDNMGELPALLKEALEFQGFSVLVVKVRCLLAEEPGDA